MPVAIGIDSNRWALQLNPLDLATVTEPSGSTPWRSTPTAADIASRQDPYVQDLQAEHLTDPLWRTVTPCRVKATLALPVMPALMPIGKQVGLWYRAPSNTIIRLFFGRITTAHVENANLPLLHFTAEDDSARLAATPLFADPRGIVSGQIATFASRIIRNLLSGPGGVPEAALDSILDISTIGARLSPFTTIGGLRFFMSPQYNGESLWSAVEDICRQSATALHIDQPSGSWQLFALPSLNDIGAPYTYAPAFNPRFTVDSAAPHRRLSVALRFRPYGHGLSGSTEVAWSAELYSYYIRAGETHSFICLPPLQGNPYASIVAPLASTDYRANTHPDGSGADRTTSITVTAVSLQPFPNKNSLTVVAADPLPNSEEGVYLTHLQARSPFVFTTAGTADALYKEDSGIPALPPFFARYGTDHFQAREMARAIQLHMSYSAPRVTVELRASSPPDDEALLALRRLNNWTITVPATLSSIVDPTSSLLVESWKLRVRPDRAPTASVTLVSKKTAFQPPPPPVTAWSNPTPDAKSLPTFVYTGLAVDAGRIYALNATDGTVYRYQSWAATAFDTKNLSGSGWRGIDVNGDLLYVVSHTPPVITRYATWASTPGETKTLPADKFYNAVAVDGEQIYALEYFTTTPRILRYSSWADADPEFKSLPHVTSTAVAYAGLAVSGGIIYVADPHNNRVIRYQSWADNDPDFKTVDHEGEQGLAYSASTLYTLADTSNTVYRYSPSP